MQSDLTTMGRLNGKGPWRKESVEAVRNGRSGMCLETGAKNFEGEDFRSKG
jgi:hypothetical protein